MCVSADRSWRLEGLLGWEYNFSAVFRIRDISVRSRIRGFGYLDPYTRFTDPDPALDLALFVSVFNKGINCNILISGIRIRNFCIVPTNLSWSILMRKCNRVSTSRIEYVTVLPEYYCCLSLSCCLSSEQEYTVYHTVWMYDSSKFGPGS